MKQYIYIKEIDPLYEKFANPSGFIQYKGTYLCMDLNCICGELSHIDGDFISAVQCPFCDKVYLLPIFIKLIPLSDSQILSVKACLPSIKIASK